MSNMPFLPQLKILNDDVFVGQSFICQCTLHDKLIMGIWTLESGKQYALMNENGKVSINKGCVNQEITIRCQYNGKYAQKTITVSYETNQLMIECPVKVIGTSGNAVAVYNQNVVSPVWSITSEQPCVQIGLDGNMTITASGNAVIQASYLGYTAIKEIQVEYLSGTSSETIVGENGDVTTSTTTTVSNPDGTTTVTKSSTVVMPDGFMKQIESTLVENEDGSSVLHATTSNIDGTTSQQEKTTNVDGSSQSTTSNYDSNGNLKSEVNEGIDVYGNASTQNVAYDSSQNREIVGYSIDTSGNPDGYKTFNVNGVNTEFYGFDAVDGFQMNIHFIIDFTAQPNPTLQQNNHHQIVTMKRQSQEPWYGFHLRHSGNSNVANIKMGIQYTTGQNISQVIYPTSDNWIVHGKSAEFNFQVTYRPWETTDTFVCQELISQTIVHSSDNLFPDIPELRYLTVCVGCGLDDNGQLNRYSNIDVLDFNLEKLYLPGVAIPEMSFSENIITLTCSTTGAEIYYRIGDSGQYVKYSEPLEIAQNTTIYAYSSKNGNTSEVVSQYFEYDDGIEEPVIICDGEQVEINCNTQGADIYYRIGSVGEFTLYSEPIELNQTVDVYAYSTIEQRQSEIVNMTCVYNPVVLESPTIICHNNIVVISCGTSNSQIYYRIGNEGSFVSYESPFEINATIDVYAYSTHRSQISQTVSQTCEYTPAHDYATDYLTFNVLTPGTICWRAVGGLQKTIEYSINDGAWTSLTSSSSGESISVAKDDLVRFRGNNTNYATSKSAYSAFGGDSAGDGGTATYEIQGNIMSLLYGDNFQSTSALTNSTYQFCSLFKNSMAVSAKNMVLPSTTLTIYCYRAMFSKCSTLIEAPALPATTLAQGCYYYMFEACSITESPELNATTLVKECYYNMFNGCSSLNIIVCRATDGISISDSHKGWTTGVSSTGVFVKANGVNWGTTGVNGIPTGWTVMDDVLLYPPTIMFDGEDTIMIQCVTAEASIYYRLNQEGEFQLYTQPIVINNDAVVETYSMLGFHTSATVSQSCIYVEKTPYQRSNMNVPNWTYSGTAISTPYSVNAIDGHSSKYARGTFTFDTNVMLKEAQPTYLWFQHADQSVRIFVNDAEVEEHWGGYNAFFCDISEYVVSGTNKISLRLCNSSRTSLAPYAGDFNFNATLGNVKLFTSPCLPAMKYGYDGFHITSTVSDSSATINIKTTVPSGAQLICTITNEDGYEWTQTKNSNGEEQTFTTTITGNDLHLWGGISDPYLYNVKLEIYKDNKLYHRYERPYGFRYYSYVINQTIDGNSYTGFLLNGHPYFLRGVCMHDDLAGKANALTTADYDQEFAIIQELGCNFIRLAHYPHPKEVYDRCDQLGIIVQTEVPCVNKFQSSFPEDYYTHLEIQYRDMVEQHFNHSCIMFWGMSNETVTDDKAFAKAKIEEYRNLIKDIDSERLVGYVMSQTYGVNPSGYYNDPNVDWFGCNIYVGWYDNTTSNDPTTQINTRLTKTLGRISKPIAMSEYGGGGTQHCHSDDFMTTTTPGNNERHDIEYQMWLHEGHIAAIRNFPQLLFTSVWQLFDIAVSNRNEGYIECLDGVNTTTNDELRRLNNKGLVERDHVTKKDTFYLYKAEWNQTDKFVHICGKDYTKTANRVLKCYTNDGNSLSLYEGNSNTPIETVQIADHIAQFTARNFTAGVAYRVVSATASDTVTF